MGAADDDLVFRGRDGGELRNNFDRPWRAAREAEDVKLPWFRVHDLRHEAAPGSSKPGERRVSFRCSGGWSSLELVERYSKADQNRIRETLERVALPVPQLCK